MNQIGLRYRGALLASLLVGLLAITTLASCGGEADVVIQPDNPTPVVGQTG